MKSLKVTLYLILKQRKRKEQESGYVRQMVKQVFLVGGCAKETSKMPKSISLAFHRNVLEPSGA